MSDTYMRVEDRIVEFLRKNPGSTATEIAWALTMDPATIRRYTRRLCGEGRLKYIIKPVATIRSTQFAAAKGFEVI